MLWLPMPLFVIRRWLHMYTWDKYTYENNIVINNKKLHCMFAYNSDDLRLRSC